MNTLINKSNNLSWQEGFNLINDKSIDLIITSPPYNLGGKFHQRFVKYDKAYDIYNDNIPEEEYQKQQIEFLNKCYDKLADNGSMFYNHKPRIKNGLCIHPLEWILKSKFILKQEIIWKSGTCNFDKIRFYPYTERIYWLVKSTKTKLCNTENLTDVWEFQNHKRNPIHNATFPESLPNTIIKCFPQAKLILDPYGGTGTVGVSAYKNNKNFILFEISKKYNDYANERIKGVQNDTI